MVEHAADVLGVESQFLLPVAVPHEDEVDPIEGGTVVEDRDGWHRRSLRRRNGARLGIPGKQGSAPGESSLPIHEVVEDRLQLDASQRASSRRKIEPTPAALQ